MLAQLKMALFYQPRTYCIDSNLFVIVLKLLIKNQAMEASINCLIFYFKTY